MCDTRNKTTAAKQNREGNTAYCFFFYLQGDKDSLNVFTGLGSQDLSDSVMLLKLLQEEKSTSGNDWNPNPKKIPARTIKTMTSRRKSNSLALFMTKCCNVEK